MFSGCPSVRASVRPCVRASVRAFVRACVRPSVLTVLAQLQENRLTDLHKNFTIDSSRVKDELIRFWPYMVMFHGNGGAKYSQIGCFWLICAVLLKIFIDVACNQSVLGIKCIFGGYFYALRYMMLEEAYFDAAGIESF